MKTILKFINASNNIVSTTNALNVVTSANIDDNINKTNDDKEFINMNYDFFEQLSLNINDKKMSMTKAIKDISKEDFKKLLIDFIDINSKNIKNISVEDFKKNVLNDIDPLFDKFKREMKTVVKGLKNEIQKSDEKFINDVKNQYISSGIEGKFVNIRSGEETLNSKILGIKYNQLSLTLQRIKEMEKLVDKNVKYYQEIVHKLNIALTAVSVISVVTSILGFFFPAAWTVTTLTSITSFGLSIAKGKMTDKLNAELTRLSAYKDLITGLDKSEQNPYLNLWSYISNSIFQYNNSKYAVIIDESYKNIISQGTKFTKWRNISKISKVTGSIGTILSGIDLTLSAIDLAESDRSLKQINDFDDTLMKQIEEMESIVFEYRNKGVKWVVINETKQDGDYWEGGTGGKNLEFKNILEDEIYTLNQLLSYSRALLYSMGLVKVYNSKTGEWYIRTLPNNTKRDNLG